MKKVFSVLLLFQLLPVNLFAWTDGELLIWMDPGRGQALDPIVQKFETDFGVKVTIETPEKITRIFPIAAQVGKGPDIVIWAHDKIGDGVSVAYLNRSSPNHDLIKEFLEQSLLSEEGLTAMNKAKPIGIPALISLYQEMAKDNPLLQALKVSVDHGQVMPNIPQMGRFFSSLGPALEIAVNGQLSPEAALQEAQANMLHR